MKLFICLSLIFSMASVKSQDLDIIRLNYTKAVSDKQTCKEMISELEKSNLSGVQLAYLGAFQTIWANHVSNPIDKLTTFRKGKKNIEKAVSQNADEVEIRFVRLSIQNNVPAILGYKSDIDTDKNFVLEHFGTVRSKHLQKLIRDFFEDSDLLTQKEEQVFEN